MFLSNKLNMGAGSPAAPADAQFNYVTMLLHGDGTNGAQNNTFLDSSTNNFTITRNGNTTQGSFSPYGSNWSNYFPTTSGDYLTIANNAAFTLGNTFTVECWLFRTTNDDGTIVGRWYAGNSSAWLMHIYSGGKLAFGLGSGSYNDVSASTIPLNTWTHLAVSNDTTSKRFYINGVLNATFSSDNCNSLGSINLTICQNTGGGYGIPSYISNLRIVKGTAVYTSNFTPSTTPLTAISGTSLLTCQSNRFIDNSTNNFTITPSGSPSVQRFNPFGASTAYSTSVIGGSGYFDGSGDVLNAPDNAALEMGSSDFTMEAWLYPNDSGWQTILTKSADTATAEFQFYAYNNAVNFFGSAGSTWNVGFYTGAVLIPKAWNHVAVTRSGSNWTIWVNGVSQATATASFTISNNTSAVAIGAFTNGVNYANGYFTDVRIVKGTAVYTTAFTPPTAPLTAITNTSLLLNFTNGAIYDNAMMNDLETVGNAQISTSVKKYGTGSLAFDGTGDYLFVPTNQNMNFGSGNFTIEMWIYPVNVSSIPYLIDGRSTSTASENVVTLYVDSSQYLTYWVNGSARITASSTVSLNTWSHVAVVKNSGTTTMYLNGTSVGTWTDGTTYIASSYLIGQRTATSSQSWNGYIDDLRITKGYARYTANFTPPTAAFSNTGPV